MNKINKLCNKCVINDQTDSEDIDYYLIESDLIEQIPLFLKSHAYIYFKIT